MQSLNDGFKREKDLAIFLGSFSNPEAAQKIIKRENPDIASSDEDWENTTNIVRQEILKDLEREQNENPNRKRRKRHVIR